MARKRRSDNPRTSGVIDADDEFPSVASAKEPCRGCGEETAVGSAFFSDRHSIEHEDGPRTYLCTLCDSRIRSSRVGKRMTDADVRRIVENETMAALAWSSSLGGQGS